jgi:Tol biopolymer transport system component
VETPRPAQLYPALSPDDQRVAVVEQAGSRLDIWVLDVSRGMFTRAEGSAVRPLWTPDGRWILFASDREGPFSLFRERVDGTGEAERLTSDSYRVPTSISSDGTTVIFRQLGRRSTWDIGMVRLAEEAEPILLLETDFNERTGKLSPDDRWLAYVSDETGRDEIYVTSFPDLERRWQISSEGGTEPLWARNGGELFYRNDDNMMAVSFSTDPDFSPGRPSLLFVGRYKRDAGIRSNNYDISRDGERFLMIREDLSTPPRIHVILNWFQELERVVPAN